MHLYHDISGGKAKGSVWINRIPFAYHSSDWIGLRENLQETIDFPIKYGSFL